MKHAKDDHPFLPVFKERAQIIQEARSGAEPSRGKFDMEGSYARPELVAGKRAGAFRIFGDHLDRPIDEARVATPL